MRDKGSALLYMLAALLVLASLALPISLLQALNAEQHRYEVARIAGPLPCRKRRFPRSQGERPFPWGVALG